jgi:hypothetical protein
MTLILDMNVCLGVEQLPVCLTTPAVKKASLFYSVPSLKKGGEFHFYLLMIVFYEQSPHCPACTRV